MAGDLLTDLERDEMLAEFGEQVTWLYQGDGPGDAITTTAQVLRNVEGTLRVHQGDGDSEQDYAEITIRMDKLPNAKERDTVTIPVSPGSAPTELFVVGNRLMVHGDVFVTFAIHREARRRETRARQIEE